MMATTEPSMDVGADGGAGSGAPAGPVVVHKGATDFLTNPPEAFLLQSAEGTVDNADRIERLPATYANHSERFRIRERSYRQFASFCWMRLKASEAAVCATAQRKWPDRKALYKKEVLHIKRGQPCWFVGIVFKSMKLKPNILDEVDARENYEAPPPERSKYADESDQVFMEDISGRVELSGDALAPGDVVSGVIMAVFGVEDCNGSFVVNDYCFAGLPPQKPLKPAAEEKFVCLVSGFGVAAGSKSLFPLQLFIDYLSGQLGSGEEQQQVSKIVRLVIAGDLIGETENLHETQAAYLVKNAEAETVSHMKELDDILEQLASSVPTDMMAGANDPANTLLPQQPLNRCMFPQAGRYRTLAGVTNPYDFEVDGISMLGTSGQGVDDVYRFSGTEDRIDILEATLRWGHLFPTCPDTLGCFPFKDADPFVLRSCPHVYFAGNQPAYQARQITGPDGQAVQLICVPRFDETKTAVLVNLQTLESTPMSFDGFDL